MIAEEFLPEICEEILQGKKGRSLDAGFVRMIAEREIHNAKNKKDALKNTKAKLYQTAGAFRDENLDYSVCSALLNQIHQDMDQEERKSICRQMMNNHASTRERVPFLDEFYTQIFSQLPAISTICDLACGLNPLAIPWMPIKGISYYAYDLYTDMAVLLNQFCEHINIDGHAMQWNLLDKYPTEDVQLSFLLKTIPCLEQVDKQAGCRILEQMAQKTDFAVVSFPSRSLSGRNKGMSQNYEAHFLSICNVQDWEIQKMSFPNELVFLLRNRKRTS